MIYFVSYDIADVKRLQKTAKILENFGERIQYSFFECEIEEKQKNIMIGKILKIIDPRQDCLIVFPVCETCFRKIREAGHCRLPLHNRYLIL
ncbi:MAG: CRISPR-associated endonuclease Cas2 [Spirochaetia bacterium]|nr:CRISPR-associated endonuclease Cas2 [Spirochaetia bacterium]